MSESSAAVTRTPTWHVTQDQARQAALEPDGVSAPLLRHGSMRARYIEPVGEDPRMTHDQDEIYLVMDGYGALSTGETRSLVAPGDVLFVPAGQPHRFVDFTVGFAVWAILYGPDGGEAGR